MISMSAKFKALLTQKFRISAREACSWVHVEYSRAHASTFYAIRSQVRKNLGATPKSPYPRPVFHALTLYGILTPEQLETVDATIHKPKEAPRTRFVRARWYISRNRNGQRVFTNSRVLAMIFPATGLYRVQFKGDVDEARAREIARVCLERGGIGSSEAIRIAKDMAFGPEHRTFYVGPVPKFRIDTFKPSLGLSIYSDKSHPNAIEVSSEWPGWTRATLPTLQESMAKFDAAVKTFGRSAEMFGGGMQQLASRMAKVEELLTLEAQILKNMQPPERKGEVIGTA